MNLLDNRQCTDTDNVPEMRFDFVDLSGISELEKDQMCDILAVVKEVGELGSITSKATQRPVRDLTSTLVSTCDDAENNCTDFETRLGASRQVILFDPHDTLGQIS